MYGILPNSYELQMTERAKREVIKMFKETAKPSNTAIKSQYPYRYWVRENNTINQTLAIAFLP